MVDHVPCYDRLARDKPVVRRERTYPVTNFAEQTIAQLLGAFRAGAANALVTGWLSWSRWQRPSCSSLEEPSS
jgi:hypothetical protein